MKRKVLFMVFALALILVACMPSQEQIDQILNSAQQTAVAQVTFVAPTSDVDTIVQATFQALTAQAASATPSSATGGIAGQAGQSPDYIGVFDVNSDAFYKLELPQGASSYQINDIPAGTYYVLGFIDGGAFAAPFPTSYSKFVTCGMVDACTDHSLIQVNVAAGQVTQGIDVLDNWGNPDLNPYVSKIYGFENNSATDNIPTFTPEGGLSGGIAGQLSYPSSFIPAQAVIAFHINGDTTDYYYYVVTNEGSNTYQIDNLPSGNYYIVAYVVGGGLSAGYSQAVPCGLSVDCTDHSLIPVSVIGGQVTQGVNPQDWYAPEGSFPVYPLP